MTKQEIRQWMLEQRKHLSSEEILKMSHEIVLKIRLDEAYQKADCVAIFYPMKGEVNLLELIDGKKNICFPKVEHDGIHFYMYDPDIPFVASSFGVLEPDGGKKVDHLIDYMLVPLLAISHDLYRVGYGKGYYDQFLSKHRPKDVVGVLFDFQLIEDMPYDTHDQPLDRYLKGTL